MVVAWLVSQVSYLASLERSELMSTPNIDQHVAHVRQDDGVAVVHTLEDHLTSVSLMSRKFSSVVGLPLSGELIGLVHDLGKYSDEFQGYIRTVTGFDQDEDAGSNTKVLPKRGSVDHSTAGAQLIYSRLFSAEGNKEKAVAQALSLCVASHHSGLIDCLTIDGEDNYLRRMCKEDEKTHTKEVVLKADPSILKRANELLESPELVEELIARLHDIRSSNENDLHTKLHWGLLVRILLSCLLDADRVDTADFCYPAARRVRSQARPNWKHLANELEDYLSKRFGNPTSKVHKVRHRVSLECLKASQREKGLYTLTVPTGGGKTLSGLRFALNHAKLHDMDRVLFCIPFTSIIEQNAKVVSQAIPSWAVLEHHSNLSQEQSWRSKVLSENWDSPVVYTTNVQVMEALFGGLRGARRMHQLANSVVVFDEYQSIPTRLLRVFLGAVDFLVKQCGSTVVLCSATRVPYHLLDTSQCPDEILEDVDGTFSALKRVEAVDLSGCPMSDSEIVDLAIREAEASGSVLVVVNKKKSARALFLLLRERGVPGVYHLSTSMCPKHRMKVLAEVKSRLKGGEFTICVSTQLIEAGVDIDFGTVIRYLAGLDSIQQAAGRCNREGLRDSGKLYVVKSHSEGDLSRGLRSIKLGADTTTSTILQNQGTSLLDPEMVRKYYSIYFSKDNLYDTDGHYELLSSNNEGRNGFIRRNGKKPRLAFTQAFMRSARSFNTIEAPTQGIVIPYDAEAKELIAQFREDNNPKYLRKLQRYAVSLYPQEMTRITDDVEAAVPLDEEGDRYVLSPHLYSDDFGVNLT